MSDLPDFLLFLLDRLQEEGDAARAMPDDPIGPEQRHYLRLAQDTDSGKHALLRRVATDIATIKLLVKVLRAVGDSEPTEEQKKAIQDLMYRIARMSKRHAGHPDFPEAWRP